MEEILKKYSQLNDKNVPRETYEDFEKFVVMLQKANEKVNIISKDTASNEIIWDRHIIDSMQSIEFMNLNNNKITDIGSGGGMPGIVLAILIKSLKKSIKIDLYEKSHHKSSFLRKASRDLKLNTDVIQKNIFETQNLESGTIIARAFKPLPVVLELVYKNFYSYKNLVLFMGKNGEKILEGALKVWNFDFEKKKSITSQDSFLLNIKKNKKK